LQRQGEFGSAPHPLEIWWLRLHGAAAFAALWLGGLLWSAHVRPALTGAKRRASGILLVAAFGVLAGSGYLRYYAHGGGVRDAIGVLHWLVGLALLVPLLWHSLRARSARLAQQRAAERLAAIPPPDA